jgi:secretion/DNA translocation related TadE-like protein
MNSDSSNESGQVTLLVLAFIIGTLSLLPVIGSVAWSLIEQQRLNNLADSAALSGAMELEFNTQGACSHAESLVSQNKDMYFQCDVSGDEIRIQLRLANNGMMRLIRSELTAESKAGLVAQ